LLALLFAWFAAVSFAASLLYFLYAYLVVYGDAASGPDRAGPALVNVALFSIFALHHSLFARTGLKRWLATILPARLERSVYTLVASALFAAVCWWWMPVPGVVYSLAGPWRWGARLIFIAGVVVTLLSARRLDALDLAGVRQVLEAPEDHPRARPDLLTTGLYGMVRHPIYLGWILLMAGVADMTMTRLVFAVVSTAYLAAAIPFEERSLGETFGPDYASYQQKVRWRMLPWLY
jgi:protein-S-isoprenylcysteine O-methyltransferase Ste14